MTTTESLPLNTPKRNLQHWLDKPGLVEYLLGRKTQAELAAQAGVSQPTVNQWVTSVRRNYSVTPQLVRSLVEGRGAPQEDLVGVVRSWLLEGFSKPNSKRIQEYVGAGGTTDGLSPSDLVYSVLPGRLAGAAWTPASNNISHTVGGTPIPVLSTIPAGKLTEAMRDEALGMVLATSRKASKACYALSVVGDSMTAPPGSTDSFPEGCTIIIKPCDEAVHGQFVVAQNDETGEWTFKKYQSMGLDSPLLIPLNPVGHLPIDIGKARLRVVGALIEVVFSKTY